MDHQAIAQLLGNYGEFIGALAVVATLAYVAIQLKQSTNVARATVRQSITDSVTSMATSVMDHDDLARIVQKGFDGEALEPHELRRFEARCYVALRRWENIYFQYCDGLVFDDEWESYRENLRLMFLNRLYQEYWVESRQMFARKFQEQVVQILPP